MNLNEIEHGVEERSDDERSIRENAPTNDTVIRQDINTYTPQPLPDRILPTDVITLPSPDSERLFLSNRFALVFELPDDIYQY